MERPSLSNTVSIKASSVLLVKVALVQKSMTANQRAYGEAVASWVITDTNFDSAENLTSMLGSAVVALSALSLF